MRRELSVLWFVAGASGCTDAVSCVDLAETEAYKVTLDAISDACVTGYGYLPDRLDGGEFLSSLTVVGFTETSQALERNGCDLRFEIERVDPIERRLVTIRGDRLIGDGRQYRGSVSIEWFAPKLDPSVRVNASTLRMAKGAPVCSATAEASVVPDPASAPAPRGAAASAALAGRGG